MNLVSFSIRTKGLHNFARRLWTVFARFGVSEARIRRSLYAIIDPLKEHGSAPTFFIPAVVLQRHPALLRELAGGGTEVGIHGYVHNDYRTLTKTEQLQQTKRAIDAFRKAEVGFEGFRNPYLGWTDESLEVFETLGLGYESNEAVLHEVIDLDQLTPTIRGGYEKSLDLFQAIPCTSYTLRPHVEGGLLRIPTSIPDDEMLFDRLRMTDPTEVGRVWSQVLSRVYDLEGIYVLNLHPERGVLCQEALATLLSSARGHDLPIWIARLQDVAAWWKERSRFAMSVTPVEPGAWEVDALCTPRATLLVRNVAVDAVEARPWNGAERRVEAPRFVVRAERRPVIGVSDRTPDDVLAFLQEQGYAVERGAAGSADNFALFLDAPAGLGGARDEQIVERSTLLHRVESADVPLVRFGYWPDGARAALSITGDIDSVTVQDFFLRIVEVR